MCPELQTPVWIAAAFQLDSTLLLHIMLILSNARLGQNPSNSPCVTGLTSLQPISYSCWWPPKWSESFDRGLRAAQTQSAFSCQNHPWIRTCFANRIWSSLTKPWSFGGSPAANFLEWENVRQTQGLWPALLIPLVQERAESDKDSCQKAKVTH